MRSRILVCVVALLSSFAASAGTIEVPARNEEARALGERPPQSMVVNTPAAWLRKTEHAGVVYFLYAFPARVERFDLGSGALLPSIPLSAVPRGLAVSAAGIFVSQNTKVSRFELDGSAETSLGSVWTNADDLAVIGNYLLTTRTKQIQSVRISDLTQTAIYESIGGYYTPRLMAVAPQAGVIFGWQTGLSPSDMLRIPFSNGTFGDVLTSPYHGDFPAGLTVFPDATGQRIIDDAGIAFNGIDLTFVSGTGGPVNDVVVSGANRFVLRSNSVSRLDDMLREQGMVALAQEAHAIAVKDDTVFLFRDSGSGPVAQSLPLAQFSQPATTAPPDPRVVPYIIDYADVADDGTLYLFNRAQRVVHRFSIPQWTYLPSIALPLNPLFAAVDRAGSRVYVAYENGRLGVIPANSTQEQFLAFGPVSAIGLGAADDLLMTCDYTGAWESHRIYNSAGSETDWVDWNHYSREFSWSRATRRMFFFRDTTSPNDLHFEEIAATGQIIAAGETPYHGEVNTVLPIRPSQSGALVYLGSGQVYDGINLSLVGNLPIPPLDASWLGNTLYSLATSPQSGGTRLIRWNQNNTISSQGVVGGSTARIFAYGAQIISVSSVNSTVSIQRWPASLAGVNVSTLLTHVSPPVPPGGAVSFTAEVTNQGLTAVNSVQLEIALSAPIDQLIWLCDGAQGSIPCGTPTGVVQVSAALAPGETLRATAFGTMPLANPASVNIVASASGMVGDVDPLDNVATGTIGLQQDAIFGNGFD